MKGIISFLILVIISISCNNQNKDKRVANSDNSDEFLALFREVNPLNLHVYPLNDKKEGQKFKGQPIDVKKFSQVNNEKIFRNIKAARDGFGKIYAIGKFAINEKLLGLLIRQWSQYEESSIELLLWDKNNKRVTNSIQLADSFGDEGWYFDKESWLVDFRNGNLTFLIRQKDFIPNVNLGDSIVTDTIKIVRLQGMEFITAIEKNANPNNYELINWDYK